MQRATFAVACLLLMLGAQDVMAQSISSRAADLRIGGRLHTQYAASSAEDGTDEFLLRRGRLTLDLTVTEFFSARIQPEMSGGKMRLQDAYVRLDFSDAFQVYAGQMKRSFDLFELFSSTDFSIIERDGRVSGAGDCAGVGGVCSHSRLSEKLAFAERDQGVKIAGSGGKLSYQATLTNGTGANTADENDAKSMSGRVTFDAGSNVAISAQVGNHDYLDDDDETARATAFGGDIEVGGFRDGLHLAAGLLSGENWKAIEDAEDAPTFMTWQAVASFYSPLEGDRLVGVEPVVRLSFADPNTDGDDDAAWVFTPGIMLYVMGKNRIGANLDVYSPQAGDTEFSFKLQSYLYF